jgi:hypothetical protein
VVALLVGKRGSPPSLRPDALISLSYAFVTS